MKKKKVLLMTGIAFILLVAVLAAALNAVFTLTVIEPVYRTFSSEGEADVGELQTRLEERFIGKSTTFLKTEEVRKLVAEYPCLSLDSVRKIYPGTLSLTVSERRESFAFRRENGLYAILDENGIFLSEKEGNVNRKGGSNILLENFGFSLSGLGRKAEGKYFAELLSVVSAFGEQLGESRVNILSVKLDTFPLEGDYFRVYMREGVCIEIFTPASGIAEKAMLAFQAYSSLSDAEKLYGFIDILDSDGTLTVSGHHAEDGFAP